MTLSEIVELVAEEIGAERHVVWGFVRSFMDTLVNELDRGNDVKVRQLGTFKWIEVPPLKIPTGIINYRSHGDNEGEHKYLVVPAGRKLKFSPAKKFRTRRTVMSDDTCMTKYGVVLNNEKEKTANENKGEIRICPVCAKELDDAGACPEHGTRPLEPDSQ